jgi:hypothetical protein
VITKFRSLLARARRLGQSEGPLFLTIENDPEARRLGVLNSNREAMIGDDHQVALEDETTETFHARLKQIARERGVPMIILGDSTNAAPLKEPQPYLPAGPPYLPAGSKLN